MDNSKVQLSTKTSILVQFITLLIGIRGLFFTLPIEHKVLQEVLGVEMFVQIVELLFYIFIIIRLKLDTLSATRYFDWVITTPIMLITTIVYFKYEEFIEKGSDQKLLFREFLQENTSNIRTIIICNFLMLLFGYLGEINVLDRYTASILGFVFFIAAFYTIYINYAINSKIGKQIFNILATVWTMYGVVYYFPPIYQNISLNTLDVVAKNFFGIFLYYKITRVLQTK
jgi:hypothetical protein